MARKSPKDMLVSRIFRDIALTTNLQISLQVMKTITNYLSVFGRFKQIKQTMMTITNFSNVLSK